MAILQLPVRNDLPAYEFNIELDRANYTIRFRFNFRMGRWLMDLAKTDGSTIVGGVPLISNVDLFARFKSTDLPPGAFISFDQTGKQRSPGKDDLGKTVQVLYIEAVSK